MKSNEMNKEELIRLLKEKGVFPDIRCSKEDLEALINDEGLLI